MMILPASVTLVVTFCAFILSLLVDISRAKSRDAIETRTNPLSEHRGAQDLSMSRDCDVETVYSMDDAQCQKVCKSQGLYRTKNGMCVNSLIFETTAIQNRCSAKEGMLAYLIGDPMFGNTTSVCLGVDLGIRPDRANEPNNICRDGTIDIDYVKSFPQLGDCECADDRVLGLIEATSAIRPHGVCVNNNLKRIFRSNNLLYVRTV